ncbi:MAG: DUF362 domain-containing protein [candidate division Zixibacteria bacterium]|nr:DUF362 domain-containing protein [candidate division Zixibacteria bacterium]
MKKKEEKILGGTITRRDFIKSSVGTAFILSLSNFGLAEAFGRPIEEESLPDLAVVSNGTPALMTRKVMELLGGMKKFVTKGDIVVVKPNIGWDRNPEQAADTNPEVVAEVVKMCLECGARKVKVFDRTCNTPSRCYENSGIKKAASEAGAEVSYVVDTGFSMMKFPQGEVLKKWYMYKPAIEADVLINVPIAKHHGLPKLTLGMKNLMGIMGGDRGQIHWNIDDNLADLANFVKPELTILDAYRILVRNGPQGGSLKDVIEKKTIIAGKNIATVDAYGATLFGMKPTDLGYVVKANKFGLGEIDLNKVNIKKVAL